MRSIDELEEGDGDGGKFEDASEQAVRRGTDRLRANYVAGECIHEAGEAGITGEHSLKYTADIRQLSGREGGGREIIRKWGESRGRGKKRILGVACKGKAEDVGKVKYRDTTNLGRNGDCLGEVTVSFATTPIMMAVFILCTWLTHETRNQMGQKLKKIFILCLRPWVFTFSAPFVDARASSDYGTIRSLNGTCTIHHVQAYTTRHPRELKNHDCRFAGHHPIVSSSPI